MNIQPLHPNFRLPSRATDLAGGYDLYMPEAGEIAPCWERCSEEDLNVKPVKIPLGFAAEVPPGYVALLLPRSSTGAKHSIELENTCGVIDADYRGEWFAFLNTKNGTGFSWEAGDRILQYLLVPVYTPELTLVDSVSKTARGEGGIGSTGKA